MNLGMPRHTFTNVQFFSHPIMLGTTAGIDMVVLLFIVYTFKQHGIISQVAQSTHIHVYVNRCPHTDIYMPVHFSVYIHIHKHTYT